MQNLQFDWDDGNLGHLALHQILPVEAEQVIQNRPLDLEKYLRNGEERVVQVGETNAERILIVVSTTRDTKIRVVTAWHAKKRLRSYFLTQKRNGNVGRIEEQDVRE
ncbi:MAG: BrnT family toxin [Terracidiphilus sp.]